MFTNCRLIVFIKFYIVLYKSFLYCWHSKTTDSWFKCTSIRLNFVESETLGKKKEIEKFLFLCSGKFARFFPVHFLQRNLTAPILILFFIWIFLRLLDLQNVFTAKWRARSKNFSWTGSWWEQWGEFPLEVLQLYQITKIRTGSFCSNVRIFTCDNFLPNKI